MKTTAEKLQRPLQPNVQKLHATEGRNRCNQNRLETRMDAGVALQPLPCNLPTSVAVSRCTPPLGGATLQRAQLLEDDESPPTEPLDPLAQRALDLLRADPARRLAVVNDADAMTDMPTRLGYARRVDGFVFSAVLPVNISPFSLLRVLQAQAR